jgi:hypothetical protein
VSEYVTGSRSIESKDMSDGTYLLFAVEAV